MRIHLARFALANGDAGIEQTVAMMRQIIIASSVLPSIRDQARQIAASVPLESPALAADPVRQVYRKLAAVRSWVSDHYTFMFDPDGAEVLYAPDVQLATIQKYGRMKADCDDAATLYGSLCRSLGASVCIVCVGFSDSERGLAGTVPFTHTWSQAAPSSEGKAWIEGDVTRHAQQIPMERIARVKTWPV